MNKYFCYRLILSQQIKKDRIKIGLGGGILSNLGSRYVWSWDRYPSFEDECKNNYIRVGRKIKRYSLVDKEYQGNQLAL